MFARHRKNIFLKKQRRRLHIAWLPLVFLAIFPAQIEAESKAAKSTQPPLFSVSLTRDFPDPKTALDESVKIILEN